MAKHIERRIWRVGDEVPNMASSEKEETHSPSEE